MKTVEERLRSYEPLWENWTYTGNFLGQGAMSSVFEIHSEAMGMEEIAALKVITVTKNPFGEVKIPESALNEIKILRALSDCPNIVRYHDSTQREIYDDDNTLSEIDILIKMEKLTPLSEGKKLSEKEVIRLAKNMCTALIRASKEGIIHRDIKPQNIFVTEDGEYKLGDFGIAKMVSEFSYHYTMNVGTLAYTAPEVQSGTGEYDIRSDIYSLGLVLYVFLNGGKLPFVNPSTPPAKAVEKRLDGAPLPPPEKGSNNLKTIVMRACNVDAVNRYYTPEEMLEALESLSSGGKKYVLDPFATQDANAEIVIGDDAYGCGATVAVPPTTGAKGKTGLKTTLKPPKPKKETPSADMVAEAVEMTIKSDTGSKIKSSIKKTTSVGAVADVGVETAEKTPVAGTRSGLKMTMKSKAVSKPDETVVLPDSDKKPELTDTDADKKNNFFTASPEL